MMNAMMDCDGMSWIRRHLWPWGIAFLAAVAISVVPCEAKGNATPPPVFIFDDGWFEEQGYRCWDVEFRWQAVPDDLRAHAWLTLYVAPEWIYHIKSYSTDQTEAIPPRHDPEYEKKHAALLVALDYCEQQHIPSMLMVRRYAKLREAAPSFETVEGLLKRYPCVKALLFAELGCSKFSDVDEEHLRGFRRRQKIKVTTTIEGRMIPEHEIVVCDSGEVRPDLGPFG